MRHRRRSRIGQALMESLEPRQLFSMSAKLPDLDLVRTNAPAITVVDTPVIPGESFTAASNVEFTRTLAVLPQGSYPHLRLVDEISIPGEKALFATIQWGDGTTGTATFRRNEAGDIEVIGSHKYTSTGAFAVKLEVYERPSIPTHYDGPPPLLTAEIYDVAKFNLTANVAEVTTQITAPGGPNDLSVVPVKTKVVVGETTGGVLAVISHQGFHLANEDATGILVRATINWGDGTVEEATLSRAGSDILVTGHHAYNRPGFFHAVVTLIPVSNDPLALVPPATDISNTLFEVSLNSANGRTVRGNPGRLLNAPVGAIDNLGGFPETGKAAQYTLFRGASGSNPAAMIKAVINWGDGNVALGQFRSNGRGGYDVIGTHRYQAEGTYRVTVDIQASYNGGPFVETPIHSLSSLALVGRVPGNTQFQPRLTYPLTKLVNRPFVIE